MARPLEDRDIAGASPGMRLEDANAAGNLLYLDFARPRAGHGPGQMARGRPIADIPLEADATFGEDTAMAYDPATGFAAIQFNPYGPRPMAIHQYLTAADLDLGMPPGGGAYGYTFGTCFRAEAFNRLRAFGLVREIEFKISLPGVNRNQFDAGHSVGAALRMPLPGGIETFSMKMSAGRGRGATLALGAAFAILTDLERLGGDLIQGTVKGKRAPGEETTSVDLVDERLTAERDIRPNLGHRFARPERWGALRDALAEWRAANQLQ